MSLSPNNANANLRNHDSAKHSPQHAPCHPKPQHHVINCEWLVCRCWLFFLSVCSCVCAFVCMRVLPAVLQPAALLSGVAGIEGPFWFLAKHIAPWPSCATETRGTVIQTFGQPFHKSIDSFTITNLALSRQLATTTAIHTNLPKPTLNIPFPAQQRAMSCWPPGPRNPFGQRPELRIISYNVPFSSIEDRLQKLFQLNCATAQP